MADSRSFGPVAEQMADALQRYSKEELIDLLTHIVKTYVVEGTLPLKPEVGTHSGDEHLAKLSFPQLILHHQMRLDHREWQLFSVSGEDVWVTLGGQRINLTERPSSLPTPPQGGQGYMEPSASGAQRRAPAAAGQGAATPSAGLGAAPSAGPTPTEPPPADAPPSAPAAPASGSQEQALPPELDQRTKVPEPFEEDIEASERFGMLEFD